MKKIVFALFFLLKANPVFAAISDSPKVDVPKSGAVKIETVGDLIGAGVGAIIVFALLMVLVFLIWGGVQWLTSGGDKAAMDAARSRITAALLGMVIVAAAWAFIKLIEYFFGVNIISGGFRIPQPWTGSPY